VSNPRASDPCLTEDQAASNRSLGASSQAPRQLVVLSGKGGTGKTSVTASLAALAPSKVLADCDVDAPDLHLVMDPVPRLREPFFSGKEAYVLPKLCAACGVCAEYCRFNALYEVQGPRGQRSYQVDPIACEGCGFCLQVCPAEAIKLKEAERGEWFISDTRHGPLVHARLNVGGENSGKLVTLVREQALALAQENGANLVLVDGPPGIGCPAIASVTGADLVLLVTEPTVSAEHDLERAIQLVHSFSLPLAVCINKFDLNLDLAEQIRHLCRSRGIPVVGELCYDTAVTKAQIHGQSIVEHGGSVVAEQIRTMWEQIQQRLETLEKAKA